MRILLLASVAAGFSGTLRIDATGLRSRRITTSIVVDRPVAACWEVVTSYERLVDILPSLTVCKKLSGAPTGRIRLYQETRAPRGIPGLNERQPITLDLTEHDGVRQTYTCVQSDMFAEYEGETTLLPLSTGRTEIRGTVAFTLKKRQLAMKGPQLLLLIESSARRNTPVDLEAFKRAIES